jgi:hypothetical protein
VNLTGDQRPSRNIIRPILCILLICGVIGFAMVMARRVEADRRARFATLPDGSTVELLGTAAGGAPFSTETKWQRLARRYLPIGLQQWLPVPMSGSFSAGSNGLVVYLRLKGPLRTVGDPLPWASYAAEDDHGFKYPDGGNMSSGDPKKADILCGLSLLSYPRRQQEFLIHLVDGFGVTVATFHASNPSQGPFSDWRPSPMPQTQTNGPVKLTLESLRVHPDQRWPSVSPKFNLHSTNPSWVNAEASIQNLFDATGNEGRWLSPREPAWKIRALVFRARPQDFATSEQFVLTNVPVPDPGQYQSLDKGAICDGVGLKVLVVTGAGTFGLSNGVTRFMRPLSRGTGRQSSFTSGTNIVETWDNSTPFLMVESRNVQSDDKVEIHAHDDSGREVKVEINGYSSGGWPGAGRIYTSDFVPPKGAKTLTVTVLVNRPLLFDFLVNPADVGRNDYGSDHPPYRLRN